MKWCRKLNIIFIVWHDLFSSSDGGVMAVYCASKSTVDLAVDPLITCKLCLMECPLHEMYELRDCKCLYCTMVTYTIFIVLSILFSTMSASVDVTYHIYDKMDKSLLTGIIKYWLDTSKDWNCISRSTKPLTVLTLKYYYQNYMVMCQEHRTCMVDQLYDRTLAASKT